MADQNTPPPADLVGAATMRSHVSTPPPTAPPHVPSSADMDRAAMSPDQRFRQDVAGADALAKSYDRPVQEPSRPGESPRQDAAQEPAPAEAGERRYVVGEGKDAISVTYDELRGAMTKMAQEAAVRATIKSPEDLKPELPPNYKNPDGIEFKVSPDNPLLKDVRNWAFQKGLSQEDFSSLIGLYAGAQAKESVAMREVREAQVRELGEGASARMDAVTVWLRATLGDELANEALRTTYTAKQVMVWEKIMMKGISGGVGQFNNVGREPQQRGIDDVTWSKMNYNERRAHQIAHAAAQQPQRGGRY